jgi:two-component system chemotaxis sensor kinase CheA
MVDHGIETQDERIEKTKPQRGSITLHFEKKDAFFTLECKDDGQGIEVEKVKTIVLEKGLKSESALKKLTEDDLLDLIFLPGLSTKTEVTDLSGRGIGLDAIRSEIEHLGGQIRVESIVDEGTTFTIWLPLNQMR